MTAHARDTAPALDPARALAIRAMISHIAAVLDPGPSHTAAALLLAQIGAADALAVRSEDQNLSLQLYGVRATEKANTIGLLRNWQQAARIRLEERFR